MAKKKAAKKESMKGHNSGGEEDRQELLKIAKAQRTLDKEIEDTKKGWTERKRNLTARLEKIDHTREQFKDPYESFCEIANAKDDADVKTIIENRIIFEAQRRKIYDALSPDKQLNWIDLVQNSDEIRKIREEEERKAAEQAAAAADDAKETQAEV